MFRQIEANILQFQGREGGRGGKRTAAVASLSQTWYTILFRNVLFYFFLEKKNNNNNIVCIVLNVV